MHVLRAVVVQRLSARRPPLCLGRPPDFVGYDGLVLAVIGIVVVAPDYAVLVPLALDFLLHIPPVHDLTRVDRIVQYDMLR